MIPEAAVEAAARNLYVSEHGPWDGGSGVTSAHLTRARAALEAAAPFIRAQVLEDAAKAWREYLPAVAGYGKVQPVPVWLERRAQWAAK